MLQIFEAPYKRMTTKEIFENFPNKFVVTVNIKQNIIDDVACGTISDIVAVCDLEDVPSARLEASKVSGGKGIGIIDTRPYEDEINLFEV